MHLGAQAVPAATRAHLDRVDWALVGVDAGVRGLDVYSTHRMLERGNHEDFLPPAIADHVPAMAAFSGGCVAAEFLTARWLSKRHPRLARLAPLADIAIDAPFAFHNLALPQVGPAKFQPRRASSRGCAMTISLLSIFQKLEHSAWAQGVYVGRIGTRPAATRQLRAGARKRFDVLRAQALRNGGAR